MSKIAFVFSGQGAQHPGMAKDLYENYKSIRDMYAAAEKTRPGITEMCHNGSADDLKKTENTQPCLFLADLAAAEAMSQEGIKACGCAGFSLGEIAALSYAGAYDFNTGFKIVCRRGELMAEANSAVSAGMTAVLKLNFDTVEKVVEKYKNVFAVNYNSPGQLVVSGLREELGIFSEEIKGLGGRVLPLPVGGAFHSPFMDDAARRFGEYLESIESISSPGIPLYSNLTAEPYGNDVKTMMKNQINHPVMWEKSIRKMADDGFDTFIETGVGSTLKKLISKILPEASVFSVETFEEAKKTADVIHG